MELKFIKLLTVLASVLAVPVFADNKMATATASGSVDGGTAVTLDDGVRTVYSREIEFKAMPNMRFLQFAEVKTELGTEPGLTVSMLTYDNLKLGGKLAEGKRIQTQGLKSSMKQITVHEQGNAISVSELLMKSSFDDIMATATNLLGRDYALTLDCDLRDTALSGTNTIYARKGDGTKVESLAELDETCTLKVATTKDAVEILATNNAPKFNGNYYVCFVHPHQSRGLRDDSDWIEASKYGAPDQLFTGEIGRIDDVRYVETTLMNNGAVGEDDYAYDPELVDLGDTNFPGYKSVIFGENYFGLAISLPVELRDNGVTDFGREHGLAWYSIWGTGILHDENGVTVITA